ncbi:MAG: Lrp/AsnC family transcriptional regulator [Actinomycetota bacterium]
MELRHGADRAIVRSLQSNARQTNRSLAADAHLAPSSTLGRVRELERRKIIRGYHADVDLAALGRHLEALVFVRLQPKSGEVVNRFVDHVWQLTETIGIQVITGIEDIVIHLAVADPEQLRRVVLTEISSQPAVYDERTSILFEHRTKKVIEPID